MLNQRYLHLFIILSSLLTGTSGCKKLIEIDPPRSTITTPQLFADNTQAEWALAAVYSKMINGVDYSFSNEAAKRNFGAGLSTILGSFSSDEMYNSDGAASTELYYLNANRLTVQTASLPTYAWTSAYKTIFDANAVIEGVSASTTLLDSVRNQLKGEALALRAFAWFYLVNFFGDVPLTTTIDYSKTSMLPRAPATSVYAQIVNDLVTAGSLLAADFSVGKGERVRINKWFAEALLARVYLFTGKYQDAMTSASGVIHQTAYFSLEQDLSNVFSTNSREAILQLKPSNMDVAIKNAVPEGIQFRPLTDGTRSPYRITNDLLNAFEPDDKRKSAWIYPEPNGYSPYKYILGAGEAALGAPQPQYYMVMRLAEMYLIRAEASLLLSEGNKASAIDDLNALRTRAGLPGLPVTLTSAEVKDAIAHERRCELFAEWGHRWLDLKRTGKAAAVLSQLPAKQPWAGDYQLLYPIPGSEILNNKHITQNPGYDVQ